MGNVSPKTANSTAIRSAIACALQVSWVPVVCYAQHVEWSGLPSNACSRLRATLLQFLSQ